MFWSPGSLFMLFHYIKCDMVVLIYAMTCCNWFNTIQPICVHRWWYRLSDALTWKKLIINCSHIWQMVNDWIWCQKNEFNPFNHRPNNNATHPSLPVSWFPNFCNGYFWNLWPLLWLSEMAPPTKKRRRKKLKKKKEEERKGKRIKKINV